MATHRASDRSGENEQATRSEHSSSRPTLCVSLGFLVLVNLAGCAHQFPPAPLADPTQAQLGTIGVVVAGFPPAVAYRTPGQGGAGGAAIGAAKGVSLGTLGAAGCLLTMGRAAGFCVLAVATPYFTVRYAVDQATTGVAADEIETGSAAIRRVLADATYPAALRDRLLQEAVTHTGLVLVLLPDDERPPTAEPGKYRHVTPLGIDTVLEFTIQQVALRPINRPPGRGVGGSLWSISATDLDPFLSIVVTARTRVVKTAEAIELYAYTREWTGRVASFTEWAANDAEQLREALDQLFPDIARDVVAQVFGVSIPRASASEAPATPNPNQEPEPEAPPSASEAKSPSQD